MTEKIAKSPNRGLGGAVRRAAGKGADVAKLEARVRAGRLPSIDDLLTGAFKKPRIGQDLLRQVTKQDILQAGNNATRRIAPTPPPMPLANRLEAFKLDRFAKGERNPAILRKTVNPRLGKIMAGLGLGSGVAAVGGSLLSDAAGGLGSAVDAVKSTVGGVADKLQGLASTGESLNQVPTPEPSSIHNSNFGGGIGETLWRNAPLLGALGAGGLGAYGLYRNYKKQQAKKTLPTIDMMPKTAAERREFAEAHPLVAGFLIACSRAGLDELRIREKIAIACKLDEDIAEEFHTAFTKYAVGMYPIAPQSASSDDAPSFSEMAAKLPPKPPAAAGAAGAVAGALDKGPTAPPTPAPLTPRPAGPMPDGSLLADQPPVPTTPALSPLEKIKAEHAQAMARMLEQQENDPRVQANRDMQRMPAPGASAAQIAAANPPQPRGPATGPLGVVDAYRAQVRGFYHPWSPEYKNLPEQDKTLRTTAQIGGAAGLAAGAAIPAAMAAAPAAVAAPALATAGGGAAAAGGGAAAAGGGALLPTAATTAAAAPWLSRLATGAKNFGTGYLKTEARMVPLNAAIQSTTPEGLSTNLLDYTLTGQLGQALYDKHKLGPEQTFSLEKLTPESRARLDEHIKTTRQELQVKYPTADPATLDAMIEKQKPGAIQQLGVNQELAKLQQATNMPPQQLQEGLAKAEQQGIDPQTEAKAGENFVKQKTEEAIKQTGAPPAPEEQAGWMEQFNAMPTGAKWLLGIGAGIGLLGLLNSLSDEGGGMAGSLALLLGGSLAAGAAAHGGMMGKDIQGATQAITSPVTNLLGNNIQPLSGDQQRMLAAVRGADLDRYQQLRSGTNPNIPQLA